MLRLWQVVSSQKSNSNQFNWLSKTLNNKFGLNIYCKDVDGFRSKWASANNGIFLCIKCSGVHRGLGVHKSFVKSVILDTWQDAEITKMQNGGNEKCREFLAEYSVPAELPPHIKYSLKAMWYWRKLVNINGLVEHTAISNWFFR